MQRALPAAVVCGVLPCGGDGASGQGDCQGRCSGNSNGIPGIPSLMSSDFTLTALLRNWILQIAMHFLLHRMCCLQFVSSFGLTMKRMPRFTARSKTSVDTTLLQELDFERSLEKEDFPPANGGSVLFKRSHLVKRMVDTFTTRDKDNIGYSNYYFCHSTGAGKTVLLKLFGKELQQRGFVVFMLPALGLEGLEESYFKKLTDKMAQDGKQVAVLVDEVQTNVKAYHWDYLLKKAPSNLLVIGTGISDLSDSPQFLDKYTSTRNNAIGPLTEEDMPEVLEHFVPQGRADSQWDLKTKALGELRVATDGQLFPFVVLAKHLLEPERVEHLSNLRAYLSSKTFCYCDDYARVRKHCYGPIQSNLGVLSRFLMAQPLQPNDMEDAMRSGLWTGTSFVSSLVEQEVFRQVMNNA